MEDKREEKERKGSGRDRGKEVNLSHFSYKDPQPKIPQIIINSFQKMALDHSLCQITHCESAGENSTH